MSGTYAGDSETSITIPFQVTNDPNACTTKQGTTTCSVVLWFGAHVARQADWGAGTGAGDIPGSPYDVSLDKLDGASIGERDNQMASTALVPNTPSITTLLSDLGPIAIGDSVHDSASISGATATAGGTVKYAVYGNLTDCNAGTYATPGGTSAGTRDCHERDRPRLEQHPVQQRRHLLLAGLLQRRCQQHRPGLEHLHL